MIFQPSNLLMAGAVAAVAMAAQTSSASANCGHDWAKPGTYTISGNFRGKNETAGAEVTRDCRIQIKVPGVYTGGPIAATASASPSPSRSTRSPACSRGSGVTTPRP
jgi:hypothetical protein